MNLLDIRDRIRDKAIDAGLTYTEIETLADTNELVNQTMPCLAWQYTGERGTISDPHNELSLQVYLMTNYYDEIKVESEAYQRDWIVTQQNELRDYFIEWIKELNFESGVTYLEVISYEEIPIAEKLTINGLLSIEYRVNIQVNRGFCLDTESVEYLNQVKVYFNDVLRYTQAANVDLELTLKDQDGNNINATFTGNNIVVNVGGGECENVTIQVNGSEFLDLESGQSFDILVEYENGTQVGTLSEGSIIIPNPIICEDASYTLKDTSGTTLSSGTIASGGTSNIVAPNATYTLKDTSGATLSSGSILSDGSDDIVAPDSSYLVEYANGTDIESGVIKSGSSLTIQVPNPTTMMGAMPTQTGQTSSYALNDDGSIRFGRLVNFTTLDYNNGFGNTNRFTDTLGGQTYANNIVIDWSTWAMDSDKVLGYCYNIYSNFTGTRNRTDWCLNAPYTCSGFSGFYLINENMRNTISNLSLSSGFNGAPFNIAVSGVANRFYTSSTISNGNAILQSHGDPLSLVLPPTTVARAMLYRVFTWNGSSLT